MSRDSRVPLPLVLFGGLLFALAVLFVVFAPDRPLPTMTPGSSPVPMFVVQIIRPRAGLPLGGLLPPEIFGLDERLGFDSGGVGAGVGTVQPRRVQLSADGWELDIVLDEDGDLSPETEVVFELIFEDQPRMVRCRPAESPTGTFSTTELSGSDELAGNFDIELARCEDADTGEALDWPPQPLVLHGSFDRLARDGEADSR